MVLLPQAVRPLRMQEQLVDALADLREGVRHEVRGDILVRRRPGLAAVIRPEGAGRRDRRIHALRVVGVDLDGVAAHSACTRLPLLARLVLHEPHYGLPRLALVDGAEESPGCRAEPER